MTTGEKIILVNDLIKESPETTIKDYLEVLAEIESIIPIKKLAKAS